jgi:serine/threonine protein kinase
MLQTTMESRSMKPQALNDWQELSALYEQADALEDADLDIWLTQLRGQAHPLLGQLEQMLDAREQVKRNGFLDAPPALRLEPEPLAHEWSEDSRIGAYRLLRRLGAGGMAEVWLAQRDDGAFQRQVAIKLLFRHASQLGGATGSTQRDSFAQRFSRERDILASLHHPNIAGLHDAGVTPTGQPWLALEYVEGEPLTDWCNQHKLGVEARVRLFRQVLLAVQHAHANLVIHRDLKPANILVTAQGEVRLLDFGIAKLMEPEGGTLVETELTRMSGRPLTVAYASPEQLLGQPLNIACDVYSLGVVLYEMLCGERPYELKVETAAQLEQAILDVEPRAPSRRVLTEAAAQARGTTPQALRKQLASDLDAIVLRALGKRPSQRYGSVDALRADIDRWLAGEVVNARTPSALYHLRKFVGRHPVGVSLGVAAIVSLLAAAAVAVWQGVQAREESARAVAARDFMLNIFQRADQEKARGATVTARDLLETGRKDVMTRLAGQPKLQAELLAGIAKIQHGMGEYADADGTYDKLLGVYSVLGKLDGTVSTTTARARNAIDMGDPKLARELLQNLHRLPSGLLADPLIKARVAEIEGWIELGGGSAERAQELFKESRRVFQQSVGPNDPRTFAIGRALVRAERRLQRYAEALALFSELKGTVATHPDALEVNERAGFDWEWLELLYGVGRYAQVIDESPPLITRCIEGKGPRDEACLMLMLKNAQALLRLGLVQRAGAEIPKIAPLLDEKVAPQIRAEAMMLMFRASDLQGDPAAVAVRERLLAFGTSGREMPVNPTFKAAALIVLSEAALRHADMADAKRLLGQTQTILDSGPPSTGAALAQAFVTSLSGVVLLREREPEQALSRFKLARHQIDKVLGPQHPQSVLLSLNEALALARLHRFGEAQMIVSRSEGLLLESFDTSAPVYRSVLRLRDRLARGQNGQDDVEIQFFS